MGIIACLKQITPEILAQIQKDSSIAEDIIYPESEDTYGYSMDGYGNINVDLGAKSIQWKIINKEVNRLRGAIIFNNKQEVPAKEVSFSADSISWKNPSTGLSESKQTSSVSHIIFIPTLSNRLSRAKEGFAKGFLYTAIPCSLILAVQRHIYHVKDISNQLLVYMLIIILSSAMILAAHRFVKARIRLSLKKKRKRRRNEQNKEEIGLDQSWQAIHFILTGMEDDASTSIGKAIMGGVAIECDVGSGYVNYLNPIEVKEIDKVLSEVSEEEFITRCEQKKIDDGIYPGFLRKWDKKELIDYLLPYFNSLKRYYHEAAELGNAMLIYFT